MRYIILIIAVTFLFACGQTNIKNKELKLKARELALKEKELALRAKDSIGNYTGKTTIPISKENAKIEFKPKPTTDYDYASHTNFQTFWRDFKKAVNSGDKNAVVKMTNIPFKDFQTVINDDGKTGRFSAFSVQQFLAKYDKIFTPAVLNAINSNKYRGWSKEMAEDEYGPGKDVIKKGEYILKETSGVTSLAFSKKAGVYKLSFIPYYP